MTLLDQLKNEWGKSPLLQNTTFTEDSIMEVIRKRIRRDTGAAFRFFWASLTLQIVVYALLTHVIIKGGLQSEVWAVALAGILLYIPFTILLLSKFKKLAIVPSPRTTSTVKDFVEERLQLLKDFYRFKVWYEFLLIPSACLIGTYIVFEWYVPGGVMQHQTGAVITAVVSLASCVWAIIRENRMSFAQPIIHLEQLRKEFAEE